jgi:F-type H+-transporting ATPase subunit gamma
MANVLDLRRRIRSVKNTRQITKAMKMVSAAKLRRAQERAMQARPYAQMLTNVLESLVRRTDLYDEETGEIMHPLLVEREEKNVLVIVIAATRALPARSTRTSARRRRSSSTSAAKLGQNIDLEPVGKKAIGSTSASIPRRTTRRGRALRQRSSKHYETSGIARSRLKLRRASDDAAAGRLRRCDGDGALDHRALRAAEIDSVYIVYNEFKSVISQRVVVEKLLPIRKLGDA